MEDKLNHIMEHYSEALEELMGAQGYANKACHAESPDARAKYIHMARQEIEHAENLKSMAHTMAKDAPVLMTVWGKLQEHLDNWRGGIQEKIKRAETGR